MSNRIYNNDRVVDKIGLTNEIKYDKIDVFVDKSNKDNVWGIVYYTEFRRNKPFLKQEIRKFSSFNDMITFVRSNFNGYELNHQVDYGKRHIFMHDVDYINIDYYLHEGKPHLNYLDLNYKEYINGNFHIRKIRLPKEYEEMLLQIIKRSQKLESSKYNSHLINTIDVYAKSDKKRENALSVRDQIEKRAMELRNISRSKKREARIKNLKVYVAGVSLISLLTVSGITIIKENKVDKMDIVTQKNTTISLRDMNVLLNKDKAGAIINDLMDNNYENVDNDSLKFVVDYIKEIENSNYDYNSSTTNFNYTDYFSYKILENHPEMLSVADAKMVLEKIEKLYNRCFNNLGQEVFINQSEVNTYIDYVASLTFMYDVNVDLRGSNQVVMNNQSITSRYATQKEIATYNNYPYILKYIILNQLKNIIYHSEYQVVSRPSNYFKGLDKEDLMNETSRKMELVLQELKNHCNYKKSM